jgi:rSAM/selenodomain-associated transferase 2
MKYQFSIIIPVLDEVYIINQMIAHLYNLHLKHTFEIIVVDGDPRGGTINSISLAEVKKIIAPKGRGVQLNRGAGAAKGDILIFLHADSRLNSDALNKIYSAFKQKNTAAGAFSLQIRSPKRVFRIIEMGVSLRGRLTKFPYGDQAIFMKKQLFFRLGGLKDIPLMEDVELIRRIKKTGGKIAILPTKVQTSARRWEKEGVLYCTLRNYALILLYLLGVSPDRLAKFYNSNRPPL